MKWLGDKAESLEGADAYDGVRILTHEEQEHMPKAERNTTYTLNGHRFRIKAGDVIPEGAVLDEERAADKAPENRAEKEAPQNRAATKSKAKKDD